jgi:hypothetical protein
MNMFGVPKYTINSAAGFFEANDINPSVVL